MLVLYAIAIAGGFVVARLVTAPAPSSGAVTPDGARAPTPSGPAGILAAVIGTPALPAQPPAVILPPPPPVAPPPPPPGLTIIDRLGPRPANAAGYIDVPAAAKVTTYTVAQVGPDYLVTRKQQSTATGNVIGWTAPSSSVGQGGGPKGKRIDLVRILTGAWAGLWLEPVTVWHAA